MKVLKLIHMKWRLFYLFLVLVSFHAKLFAQEKTVIKVPLYNNAYTHPRADEDTNITKEGLLGWKESNRVTKVYFYVTQPIAFHLSLQLPKVYETCSLNIRLDQQKRTNLKIQIQDSVLSIGDYVIKDTGYHYIEIKGASSHGVRYPSINHLIFENIAPKSILSNKSHYKGAASTHLRYTIPGDSSIQWFYTEVMVPNEVKNSVHAYYETNGFHSGYGGIQINSLKERRFIFSIWSLFKTDDPKQIPQDYIVHLNKKGEGVFTGDFGDEGSGGHSHLVAQWETNTTYRFLTGITALKGDSATYIGYYAGPKDHYQWHLLSQWTQHKTDTKTGFKKLYAFVENFGDNGDDFFKAYYCNQWAITFKGNWIELTEAKFTTTANNTTHQRFDYGAGVENGKFYMFSGGFRQKRNILPGNIITRPATGKHIDIDFTKLSNFK